MDASTLISLQDLYLNQNESNSDFILENINANQNNKNKNNISKNTSSQVTCNSSSSTSAMYSTQSDRSAGQLSMQKATLLMTK